MVRQAFRKKCSVLDIDSVCLAVTSFLFSMCVKTLLLVSFMPAAVCSPVIPAQARPLNPGDDALMGWLLAGTVEMDVQGSQSRSEFPPSVTTLSLISAASAQTSSQGAVSTDGGQGYEWYLYLLLTAGLILLAFRPATPAVAGRY